jgi:HSP20 family protein
MSTNKPMKVEPALLRPASFFEGPFGFPMFRRMSQELEDFFDSLGLERSAIEPARSLWAPRLEMLAKDGQLLIRADVPGLKKEDISIELTEDTVTFTGERKQEKEEKEGGFFRSERVYGSFYRSVPLPEGVSIEGAKAVVHDGILEITMPMAKVMPATRKLEITEPVPGKTVKAA